MCINTIDTLYLQKVKTMRLTPKICPETAEARLLLLLDWLLVRANPHRGARWGLRSSRKVSTLGLARNGWQVLFFIFSFMQILMDGLHMGFRVYKWADKMLRVTWTKKVFQHVKPSNVSCVGVISEALSYQDFLSWAMVKASWLCLWRGRDVWLS